MSGNRNYGNNSRRAFKNKRCGNFYSRSQDRRQFQNKVDAEGDVDMAADRVSSQHRHFSPYGGGHSFSKKYQRGRRGGRPFNSGHQHHKRHENWVKVIIPYGRKMEKTYLLKMLTDNADFPFIPIQYQFEGNTVVFHVEDVKAGLALSKLSNNILSPDGMKVRVISRYCPPPIPHINKELIEKLKIVMSEQYDATSNTLDMSKFHTKPELKKQGIYVELCRSTVFDSVVTIIRENIPKITTLDLSGNKLHSVAALRILAKHPNNLKHLNLGNNMLSAVSQLDNIKEFDLSLLILDNNPLCDDFKDQPSYITAVRKRFPRVMKLDGKDLPPPIGFEIGNEVKLPPSKRSFCVDEQCKSIIMTFLEQYYNVYDSNDRQPLIQAYSDTAVMSVTLLRVKGPPVEHTRESRNLLRVEDSEHRRKLLYHGRQNIVKLLSRLPKTQHDRTSFTVDITFVSPVMVSLTVTGILREFEKEVDTPSKSPIRSFSRTFIVVPQGSGITIVNEIFYLTNATSSQIKVAFKEPAPTPSPSPVPSINPVPAALTSGQQEQMILSFAEKSGMNADFSAKCLAENEWNFDKSAHTFLELKNRGVIPPEAFVK